MVPVTAKCDSFAACAEIINGGGVADYGLLGGVAFDDAGDPDQATIRYAFQYGADSMAHAHQLI